MVRITSQFSLLAALSMFSLSFVQAQQRLPWPRDFRIVDDTLHWNEIPDASGYRVRWLGRDDWITAEAADNRFALSGFRYGSTHLIQVQALSGDSTTVRTAIGVGPMFCAALIPPPRRQIRLQRRRPQLRPAWCCAACARRRIRV